MRRTLGKIGNTHIFLTKIEAENLYRWIVVSPLDSADKNEPIAVNFTYGLLWNELMSIGACLTAESARNEAIAALEKDHQCEMSGHERILLRSRKWRKLTERERRQVQMKNDFPDICLGMQLVLSNILF